MDRSAQAGGRLVPCDPVLHDSPQRTTALNDVIHLHPVRGIKPPPIPRKKRAIITPEQFDQLYQAIGSDTMKLLVEADIESGMRWGELTELRPRDLNLGTGVVTVSRVAVELPRRFHPDGGRFLIKDYPKDGEHRQFKLSPQIVQKIEQHIAEHAIGPDDLLFTMPQLPPRPLRLVAGLQQRGVGDHAGGGADAVDGEGRCGGGEVACDGEHEIHQAAEHVGAEYQCRAAGVGGQPGEQQRTEGSAGADRTEQQPEPDGAGAQAAFGEDDQHGAGGPGGQGRPAAGR
jgi:hypothetical protein